MVEHDADHHDQSPRVGPYYLKGVLGRGAYGKVKLAVKESTGERFACKIISKSMVRKRESASNVMREVTIMRYMFHVNTVSLVAVYATQSNIFIIMELVRGGELLDEVVHHGRLSEPYARFFFRQLIDGLEHCHSVGVYHRDLKPENILVDQDLTLKISDFGLSFVRNIDSAPAPVTGSTYLDTQCGTPWYTAPEMIALQVGASYSGARVDMWSCGVILYAITSGILPFSSDDVDKLLGLIITGSYDVPDYFSPELRDLVRNLIKVNPSDRFTIAQVRQHPWFNGPVENHMPGCAPGLAFVPNYDSLEDPAHQQPVTPPQPPPPARPSHANAHVSAMHAHEYDGKGSARLVSRMTVTGGAIPETSYSKDSLDVGTGALVISSALAERSESDVSNDSAWENAQQGHPVLTDDSNSNGYASVQYTDSSRLTSLTSVDDTSIEDEFHVDDGDIYVTSEPYQTESDDDESYDDVPSEPGDLMDPTTQSYIDPRLDIVDDAMVDAPISGDTSRGTPDMAGHSAEFNSPPHPNDTTQLETPALHQNPHPSSDAVVEEMANDTVAPMQLQSTDEDMYPMYVRGAPTDTNPSVSKHAALLNSMSPVTRASMSELVCGRAKNVPQQSSHHTAKRGDSDHPVRADLRSNTVSLSSFCKGAGPSAARAAPAQKAHNSIRLQTRSLFDHRRCMEERRYHAPMSSSDDDYDDAVELAGFTWFAAAGSGGSTQNADSGSTADANIILFSGVTGVASQSAERVPESAFSGASDQAIYTSPKRSVEGNVAHPSTRISIPDSEHPISASQYLSRKTPEMEENLEERLRFRERNNCIELYPSTGVSPPVCESLEASVGPMPCTSEHCRSSRNQARTVSSPIHLREAMRNDLMASSSNDNDGATEPGTSRCFVPTGNGDMAENMDGRFKNGMRRVRSLGDGFMEAEDASFADHAMTKYHSEYCNKPHEPMHAVDVQRRLWNRDAVFYRVPTEPIHIGCSTPDAAAVDVFRMEKMADEVEQVCRTKGKSKDRPRALKSRTRNTGGATAASDRHNAFSSTGRGLASGSLARSQSHDGSMTVNAPRRKARSSHNDDPNFRRPMRHVSASTNSSEGSAAGKSVTGQSRRLASSVRSSRAGAVRHSGRQGGPVAVHVHVDGGEHKKFVEDKDWIRSEPDRRMWCMFMKEINTIPDELEFGMTSEELDKGWKAKLAEENLAPAISFSERFVSTRYYDSPIALSEELRRRRTEASKHGDFENNTFSLSTMQNEWTASVSVRREEPSERHECDDGGSCQSGHGRHGHDSDQNCSEVETRVRRRVRTGRVNRCDGSCTDGSRTTGNRSCSCRTRDATCSRPRRVSNRRTVRGEAFNRKEPKGERQVVPIVASGNGQGTNLPISTDTKETGSDGLAASHASSCKYSQDRSGQPGALAVVTAMASGTDSNRSNTPACVERASSKDYVDNATAPGTSNGGERIDLSNGRRDCEKQVGTAGERASMDSSLESGRNNGFRFESTKVRRSDVEDGSGRVVEVNEGGVHNSIDGCPVGKELTEGMVDEHVSFAATERGSVNPFGMDIPAPKGFAPPSGHMLLRLPHAMETKMLKKLRGLWQRGEGGKHVFTSLLKPMLCSSLMQQVIAGFHNVNVLKVIGRGNTVRMVCDVSGTDGLKQFTISIFVLDQDRGTGSSIEFRRRWGDAVDHEFWALYDKLRKAFGNLGAGHRVAH